MHDPAKDTDSSRPPEPHWVPSHHLARRSCASASLQNWPEQVLIMLLRQLVKTIQQAMGPSQKS